MIFQQELIDAAVSLWRNIIPKEMCSLCFHFKENTIIAAFPSFRLDIIDITNYDYPF